MAVLLRKKDRVAVSIEGIKLKLAPLTFAAKMEINDVLVGSDENDLAASMKASKIAIACAVKELDGIETIEGEKYELEFDGDKLSEECVDDLLNLEICPKLMVACTSLLGGIPHEIVDPATGKPMEGVEIKMPKKAKAKK